MKEAFRRGWRDAYIVERTRSRYGFITSLSMSLRLAEREQETHRNSRPEVVINTLGLWSGSAWHALRHLGRTYLPKPITEITVTLPLDKDKRK